jgi:predicted membrane protein
MSILVLIVVCAVVCGILYACYKRSRLRWLALMIGIALCVTLVFGTGFLMRDLTRDTSYRVHPQLLTAIAFVQHHHVDRGRFPSAEEFTEWQRTRYGNDRVTYDVQQKSSVSAAPSFVISMFTGDEWQYFSSWSSRFYDDANGAKRE